VNDDTPAPKAASAALPAHFSRRSLLKKGAIGGVLLLLGGVLPIGLRSGRMRRRPRRQLLVLTPYEHAILAAVAARVVPGDGAPQGWPSADAVDCAGKIDTLLARLHPKVGAEMRQLLHLFENGLTGLFATGTPVTFTRCAPAEQDRRLEAWRRSRLALFRSGYQAMKRLAHAAYYSSPEVFARVGYPGPPVVPQVPR
jgi:hypothetical protein